MKRVSITLLGVAFVLFHSLSIATAVNNNTVLHIGNASPPPSQTTNAKSKPGSKTTSSIAKSATTSTIKVTKVSGSKTSKSKKTTPKPTTATQPKIILPGPIDTNSLGFNSTDKDIERLMGKPTQIVKIEKKEIWYYDHSTITLSAGKIIGWSTYDRPLLMNIGVAKSDAPPVKTDMTMQELVAVKGTPNAAVLSGNQYLWFYGTACFTLQNGKLIPSNMITQETKIASPSNTRTNTKWADSTATANTTKAK